MIKVLKLVTGEELVTREVEPGMFEKPRVFQMMQTERGYGAALMPYIMSNPDACIKIKDSAIIVEMEAPKQMEDAYLQQTSGLDLSTKLQGV